MPKVNADIGHPDVVSRVAARSGLPKRIVRQVLHALIEEIIVALQAGHSVHLHRLGIFATRVSPPRTTQNPNDRSQTIVIPRRLAIVFRRSRSLAHKVRHGPFGASITERRPS
ncbi:HU family DNA-binding protein [Roseiflexus castenholzii]|uniref:HU family DNA-binding protein n=1 Tax=Roseiflexus castenholzii TaxID=120962 RepID=UPI003C7B99FE